jgi:hypothetical protein
MHLAQHEEAVWSCADLEVPIELDELARRCVGLAGWREGPFRVRLGPRLLPRRFCPTGSARGINVAKLVPAVPPKVADDDRPGEEGIDQPRQPPGEERRAKADHEMDGIIARRTQPPSPERGLSRQATGRQACRHKRWHRDGRCERVLQSPSPRGRTPVPDPARSGWRLCRSTRHAYHHFGGIRLIKGERSEDHRSRRSRHRAAPCSLRPCPQAGEAP